MNYDSNSELNQNQVELNNLQFTHVDGENKGDVKLFALSTCGWCKKTRMFLEENNVAYDYIYVDLTTGNEREEVVSEMEKFNPNMSFPTIVIDGDNVIIGYDPEELKESLNI